MSFDLFFCWHGKEPVNFDSVTEWSQKHQHFRRENSQLWYKNEATGVYFSLDFEIKNAEESDIPPDYSDSGLCFNLNFNRPSFFAYESMPIVVDLCRHFGFAAYDPQGEGVIETPEVTELTNSWLGSNRNAVVTLREFEERFSVSSMPLPCSKYLWSYSRNRQDLQSQLGDDIFVPTLFPFRKGGSNAIGTMIVVTTGIPMIVPTSQWVVVRRRRKRLFGMREDIETGVVSASAFESAVGDLLSPFVDWEPKVKIMNPNSAGAITKRLNMIQDMFLLAEFERVALDSFVDFEDELIN